MARVLYVMCDMESSADSQSFKVASDFIIEYFKYNPEDELDVIDLRMDCIQQLDDDVVKACGKIKSGFPPAALTEYERRKLDRLKRIAGSFISADKYVLVTPDWNAALPDKLNEYITTVCVCGKIFRMLPGFPIGLIRKRSKKCLHIYSTAGSGMKTEDSPPPAYFRFMMNYLSISDVEAIAIENIGLPLEKVKEVILKAEREAVTKAMTF